MYTDSMFPFVNFEHWLSVTYWHFSMFRDCCENVGIKKLSCFIEITVESCWQI